MSLRSLSSGSSPSFFSTFSRGPARNLPVIASLRAHQRFHLIGHLHLLTPVAYKGFHALNNKYGPLLYLRFATYPAVLVSSAPVATEIFKAQDVHFASRIKSPI
ncbi:FLAVONOID 3'-MONOOXYGENASE-RELATED [Salix koriyanagi]|uniref:FLAVONOID 3'-MONOOXYGENASE-RELATED n=1 Tax=Salix koriyanagi TaxID=2511006 RepID=A0A9Q1AN55_9ROSI|nr:FLAVONOID 3'-MONOOXYGENASE-RELATED [Salix koriyanagi]